MNLRLFEKSYDTWRQLNDNIVVTGWLQIVLYDSMYLVINKLKDKFEAQLSHGKRNKKLFRFFYVFNLLLVNFGINSRLVIQKDKVTVENWNKRYIPGSINPDNFYTHPKNPNILEVFKQIGRADELGSGVRNVFKYGKLHGNNNPVFEEGDVFKNIVYIPKSIGINTLETGNDAEDKIKKINDAVNDAVKSRLKLEVLNMLQNSCLSLPQIMQEFSIKRATVQRDMKILRDA